jgi:hypothetical protein
MTYDKQNYSHQNECKFKTAHDATLFTNNSQIEMSLTSRQDTENFHLVIQHAMQNELDLQSASLKVYEYLSYQLPLPLHSMQQQFPYPISLRRNSK